MLDIAQLDIAQRHSCRREEIEISLGLPRFAGRVVDVHSFFLTCHHCLLSISSYCDAPAKSNFLRPITDSIG